MPSEKGELEQEYRQLCKDIGENHTQYVKAWLGSLSGESDAIDDEEKFYEKGKELEAKRDEIRQKLYGSK